MGGDSILVYVLNSERYCKVFKANNLKFIPNFLLPRYRPKVIDMIVKDDNIVGKIVGNNLKPVNLQDIKELNLFIEGIIKIKSDEDTNLYIQDIDNIPLHILDIIQDRTGLTFSSGDNSRMLNIPSIIKEVCRCLGRDNNSTDTLLISDNKVKLVDTIKLLSDTINFFTVVGIDASIKEQVYDEVLDLTGISIFQPKSIDKIIKNYGIIINYIDDLKLEMKDIRNQAVIIDFSNEKPFKILEGTKKEIIYIEDINFKYEINNDFIGNYISPDLLVGFGEGDKNIFSQIKTNNDFYIISDFIKSQIKVRRRV